MARIVLPPRGAFLLMCLLGSFFVACNGRIAKPDLSSFLENKKAAVFVFLAPDCPLSRNYTLTLNELHDEFQDDGVGLYGVVAGKNYEQADIDAFTKEYKVRFPIQRDPDFDLTDLFGAVKTPEAVVVKADGGPIYKGAIDDWAVELGQHRRVITQHHVRNVLDDVLNGREISFRETPAVGCFIERPR